MKKLLLILFMLPVFLLSGCGSESVMEKIMNSWMGCHINGVIDQWGYPDYEKNIAGRKLFVWGEDTQVIKSNTYHSYNYKACTRIFEVDNNNIIISWQWEGYDCPSFELDEYKKWKNKKLTELLQNDEFVNEALKAYKLFNNDNLHKSQKEQISFLLDKLKGEF